MANALQPIRPWPEALPASEMTLHLQFHTSRFSSPFTRSTQTQELPGALFRLTASLPPGRVDKGKPDAARAWFASLRGSTGRFYWPANGTDFRIPSAYAVETTRLVALDVSTIRVTADRVDVTIDQTDITFEPVFTPDGRSTDRTRITGTLWLNSGRFPVREGGYVSFDDDRGWRHLHIIVGVETDGDSTTLVVEPPMRWLPTADTAIHLANPSGVFMLADDDQGAVSLSPGVMGQFGTVEAVQAFPVRVVA